MGHIRNNSREFCGQENEQALPTQVHYSSFKELMSEGDKNWSSQHFANFQEFKRCNQAPSSCCFKAGLRFARPLSTTPAGHLAVALHKWELGNSLSFRPTDLAPGSALGWGWSAGLRLPRAEGRGAEHYGGGARASSTSLRARWLEPGPRNVRVMGAQAGGSFLERWLLDSSWRARALLL